MCFFVRNSITSCLGTLGEHWPKTVFGYDGNNNNNNNNNNKKNTSRVKICTANDSSQHDDFPSRNQDF